MPHREQRQSTLQKQKRVVQYHWRDSYDARSLFYPHDHSGILLQMCVCVCVCVCVSLSLSLSLSLSHITPGFHKLVFNQFQPKTVLLQHDTLVLEMIVLKCTYEELMMCTPLCAGRFWHETRSFFLEWTIRIFHYQVA
jgi:hypothetical protein